MEAEELKLELSEGEIEFLKKIHVARALQDMTHTAGWEFYIDIVDKMVQRIEEQHLRFAEDGASRDGYWVAGVRLAAVRQFVRILKEQIAGTVDLLSQPLRLRDHSDIYREEE